LAANDSSAGPSRERPTSRSSRLGPTFPSVGSGWAGLSASLVRPSWRK